MAKQNSFNDFIINDEITFEDSKEVRVIGNDFDSRVVSFAEAKRMADRMEQDLVLMNGNLPTPIIKIISYDKMVYEMKKNAKKTKSQPKTLKEIDLSVNIAKNDLETKARKAKEFISDGSKVKVVLTMRGRELSRKEFSKKSILDFIEMMSDVAVLENMPKDEGNKTSVILKKKS